MSNYLQVVKAAPEKEIEQISCFDQVFCFICLLCKKCFRKSQKGSFKTKQKSLKKRLLTRSDISDTNSDTYQDTDFSIISVERKYDLQSLILQTPLETNSMLERDIEQLTRSKSYEKVERISETQQETEQFELIQMLQQNSKEIEIKLNTIQEQKKVNQKINKTKIEQVEVQTRQYIKCIQKKAKQEKIYRKSFNLKKKQLIQRKPLQKLFIDSKRKSNSSLNQSYLAQNKKILLISDTIDLHGKINPNNNLNQFYQLELKEKRNKFQKSIKQQVFQVSFQIETYFIKIMIDIQFFTRDLSFLMKLIKHFRSKIKNVIGQSYLLKFISNQFRQRLELLNCKSSILINQKIENLYPSNLISIMYIQLMEDYKLNPIKEKKQINLNNKLSDIESKFEDSKQPQYQDSSTANILEQKEIQPHSKKPFLNQYKSIYQEFISKIQAKVEKTQNNQLYQCLDLEQDICEQIP